MARRSVLLAALLFAAMLLAAAPLGGAARGGDGDGDVQPTVDAAKSAPKGKTTDVTAAAREAESIAGGLKDRKVREGAQKFEFQAEVSRLMDIIINSLYSNKDIFLRELISNASDALDKIRFLSLTDPSVLGEGDQAQLDIRISLDKERKVLTIRDRGVGMTRDDLVKNLGTIAKSGTSAFLENMQKGGDINLIGQFGVGFYSVYLVADYVEVISKHNDDPVQHIWESKADGNFAVSEDTEGEPLGRGTKINIYLKEEAAEYADQDKLKELVVKYSEFINFPIYLWSERTETKEVEAEDEEVTAEEAEAASKEAAEGVSDAEEEEEDDGTKVEKKKKYVSVDVSDWEHLNNNKAIWLRSASEVTEDEYEKFYKALSKDYAAPLAHTHFRAEGDVEFKAILFIPGRAEPGMFDNYYSRGAGLKLYVRRVFISDEFDELLPRYLSFMKGIVDSDSLPLNVSRETLQQHSSLKTIKKKLVRKALDVLRRMADGVAEDGEEADDAGDEAAKAAKEAATSKYEKFWATFGKALKMGIVEDASNRTRLAKLLRVKTSKSGDKLASLDEYVSRMLPGQKHIYYVAGESEEALAKSPFVEKLLAKGYEVVYFTDAIDEYMMQSLTEYEDHKFQNASKEDLKLGGDEDSDAAKERAKADKRAFKPLTRWWKALLPAADVDGVKVSSRLATTPCVVVSSKYGWSANMERIMKAQALSESSGNSYMKGKKTLEINPRHPVIKQLRDLVVADEEDESAKAIASVLYETALMESGYAVEDIKTYSGRVLNLVASAMKLEGDLAVEADEAADAAAAAAADAEAAAEGGEKAETGGAHDEL